jgi:peptidoglycan-associated lipoprotein
MKKKERKSMKQSLKTSMAICAVAFAALWSGGCAKQQVVKQDQMIPPAAAAVPPAKAPEQAKQEKKDAALPAVAVHESQLKNPEDAVTAAPEASLKNALEKIFFDFDSYTLSSDARNTLAKDADLIRKSGSAKIKIEGHCDEMGSDDYNLALGEKRAKAAQKYLENMGIPSDRLSTISYGKEKPADPGHDDAARAKNRRDEFVVSSR